MVFMMGGKYFMTLTTSDNLSDFFSKLIKTSLVLIRFLKLIEKSKQKKKKEIIPQPL